MAQTPQIGTYTQEVSPQESLPRRTIPTLQPQPYEQSFGAAAQAVELKVRQDGIAQASKAMADARVNITKAVQDAQLNYQPGQDFAGTITKQFRDYHDAALKSMANPYGRKVLDQQLTEFGTQVAESAIHFQTQANVNARVQLFKDGNESAAVAVRADPSQFEQAYGERLSAIQAALLPPEVKTALATHARDTMALEGAKTIGERDPYATMIALTKTNTGDPVLNRLTVEGRDKVTNHILETQRMIQAQEAHLIQMQDRLQKKQSDDLLKAGLLKSQNGQLTPQWIEAHHGTWEPQAYEFMYRLLSGKGGDTNPQAYASLLGDAMSGQDVKGRADAALFGGQLQLPDYTRIVEASEKPRKNYVTLGSEYLKDHLAPSPLIKDPEGQYRLGEALDTWNQWVKANPSATDEQARTAYKRVGQDYALIEWNKMVTLGRKPSYLVGDRNNADLDATARATKAAADAGQLSHDQLIKEFALIDQWRAAQDKTRREAAQKVKE